MRPWSFRTRQISSNTRGLSGERFTTQFEVTRSTVFDSTGIFSRNPSRNSTTSYPSAAATFGLFSCATDSIRSVMSTPMALPVFPTNFAAMKTSMPAPEPRSTTVSPSRMPAVVMGEPQP